MPPLDVSIPFDACIPLISSGEVSTLTNIVSCIIEFNLSASSDENTTFPLAAPGDAGKPFAITFISPFSFNEGCNKLSNELGSILNNASFFEIIFSFTISTAILIADLAVLFPDLVCSIHNLLPSTVNSTSCMSL